MDIWEKLGNAIRDARIGRGMSQEYLAEKLNVTPTHVRHIESSHRKPSIELLFQISVLLDLSLDALIFENNPQIPAIHTDGLTTEEIGAIARITDLMRKRDSIGGGENVSNTTGFEGKL